MSSVERVTAGWKWEWQQDLSTSHAKAETHLRTLANGFPASPRPFSYQPLWPWEGTDVWSTDVPTLEPLLEPQGSTKAGTQLEELLAKVSPHTVTSFAGDCERVIEVLQLNAGHFITQSDLIGCNLTAHITQMWQVDKPLLHAQRQQIRINFNKIILKNDVIKKIEYSAFLLQLFCTKTSFHSHEVTSICFFWMYFSVLIMIYLENIRLHVIPTTDSRNIHVIFSLDVVLGGTR